MHKFRTSPVVILAFAATTASSAWAAVDSPALAFSTVTGSYTATSGTKIATGSLSENGAGELVTVSGSKYGTGFTASAEVTGNALKAFASTTLVPASTNGTNANSSSDAVAWFTDYLTFSGGVGAGEGTFLGSLTGTLSGGKTGSAGYNMKVTLCDQYEFFCGWTTDDQKLVDDSHSVSSRSKLSLNNQYETGFEFEFGKTYKFVAILNANATNGGTADFSHTADLSFAVGSGVALTSASGYQYNVPAVPEPSEYAMMLSGLGMLGLMAARRSKK